MDNSSRRDLLRLAGLASLGASLGRAQTFAGESVADMPFQPKETARQVGDAEGGVADFDRSKAVFHGHAAAQRAAGVYRAGVTL